MVDLDELTDEEIEKEVRQQVKVAIKTIEIWYEELKKSNLPEDIQKALLLQSKIN